ncbi:MAG: hypothetical protein NTX07_05360 [Solirubrobacterales bacterium]|nr:hypothetical protein [Solirubrobacterales bacterium]
MFFLTANVFAVVFMCGLHWFVQVVHYPLFSSVGRANFSEYHERHSSLTTFVVIGPMTVDLVTSALLLHWTPPGSGHLLPAVGLVLALVTWASTALLQVPRHSELGAGFDEATHRRLVSSSWVRTVAWTAHAGVCAAMLAAAG